jgi:SAM-dependent methyltransferase
MDSEIRKGETLLVGDRIKDPVQENVQLFFNHFGRYFYAAQALKISRQDVVIDASCGCGYGSHCLAQKAQRVYGLDINEAYLDIARRNLSLPNLRFYTYDEFWRGSASANKIVCIETFEHVPAEHNGDFLSRLIGRLTPDGSMFLTTPLGNNGPSGYNPFHCFEPSIDVLYALLSRYFGNVQLEVDIFTNSFGHVCEFCYALLRNKK